MRLRNCIILLSLTAILCSCKKQAVPINDPAEPPASTGAPTVGYSPDYNFTHLQRHVQVVTGNQLTKIYYLYSYNGPHVSHFVLYDSTFVLQGSSFVYDHLEKDSFVVEYTGNNVTSVKSGWFLNYPFTYDASNRMTSCVSNPNLITYSYTDSVVTETNGNEVIHFCFNKSLDSYRVYFTGTSPTSDTLIRNCTYGNLIQPNVFENIFEGQANYFSRHNILYMSEPNYSVTYTYQADSLNRVVKKQHENITDYYYY